MLSVGPYQPVHTSQYPKNPLYCQGSAPIVHPKQIHQFSIPPTLPTIYSLEIASRFLFYIWCVCVLGPLSHSRQQGQNWPKTAQTQRGRGAQGFRNRTSCPASVPEWSQKKGPKVALMYKKVRGIQWSLTKRPQFNNMPDEIHFLLQTVNLELTWTKHGRGNIDPQQRDPWREYY